MGNLTARGRQVPARIRLFQLILLVVTSIISYGALVLPGLLLQTAVPLRPGDVSPSDFQASRSLDYISEVRTEDARLAAENAVAPVYAPPNPSRRADRASAGRRIYCLSARMRISHRSKSCRRCIARRCQAQTRDNRCLQIACALGVHSAGGIECAGAGNAPHDP
jgi:hypothetical protein